MSKVISSKGYIGIAKQGAKGSPNNTPDIYVKYIEEGFQPEHEVGFEREGGDDELLVTSVKNLHRERFNFKVKARPNITAYLFAWILGADAVTGTGDPYTHVLTRDTRDWLTIRRKIDTNKIQVLTDAKIESITVEAEAGKELILTVEGNALSSELDSTEDTPTYETVKPFVFYHSNGAFKIETAVNQNIRKMTVKVMVTSQDGMQTDDVVLADLPDLKLDVDVTLEFWADDTDFWKKSVYNNQTTPQEGVYSGAFEFDCKFTENVADDREFKMNVAKFFWAPVTGFNLKGEPEAIVESLAGPMAKPDAGEAITVTVKNDVSTDLT